MLAETFALNLRLGPETGLKRLGKERPMTQAITATMRQVRHGMFALVSPSYRRVRRRVRAIELLS